MNELPAPPSPQPSESQPAEVRTVQLHYAGVKPIVTYTLMGVTIAVFLLQLLSQYLLNGVDFPALIGLKANDAILAGEFWRLLTPMLLHASLTHIGVNMYSLHVLGPGLEYHFGHRRFLLLYVLSGFAGNVLSFVLSDVYSLGASTAIFGLVAAQAVFVYQNRQFFGARARSSLMNILVIVGINILIGFSARVDQFGHLGGALGGLLFAWFASPRLTVTGVFPALKLVDGREPAQVWQAAAITLGAFVLLAAFKFLFSLLSGA